MSNSDAGAVATAYLSSWTTGDLEQTRSLVHDDITFVGPLGQADGVDEYMAGLEGMSKMVERADIRKTAVDGEDVCILYDLVTNSAAGAIPTVNWFEVRNGKVASVRAFFDPRPLLEG